MNAASPHDALASRVVELETLVTHLQRTLGELDQVVLAQQKQIETLTRQLAALRGQFAALVDPPEPPRNPEDERPPHY